MTDHICSDHLNCSLDHQPSINRMLWELGHFDRLTQDGFSDWRPAWDEIATLNEHTQRVKDAVASYQRFRPWLKEDGQFREVSHMASVQELGCRCGCPDVMQSRGSIAEWPEACQLEVTTAHKLAGLRISFDGSRDIGDAWRQATVHWNLACGVEMSVVGFLDDPRISATAGSMGSGTLAWSYLADGDCGSRLKQEYNQSLTWDWHQALWVIVHELGHALGLPHTNQSGNVLQPYYQRDTTTLGPWDIAQVVKRYGKPAEVPTPPIPEPQPPTPGEVTIAGGIVTLSDGREFDAAFTPRATQKG